MKYVVSFCSTHPDEMSLRKARGKFNVLESKRLKDNALILPVYGNKTKLPVIYNNMIDNVGSKPEHKDTILVLMHDDVVVTDKHWLDKLTRGLDKFDIIGLAGGSNPSIKPPALWHLMCSKDSHRGVVSHVYPNGKDVGPTIFGPQGRVLMLDGLFLAFKPSKLIEKGVKFDETNPCIAHFYDIDFSLNANKRGLTLGTTNIDAIHNSPGLKEFTKEWTDGQTWFLDKVNRGEY